MAHRTGRIFIFGKHFLNTKMQSSIETEGSTCVWNEPKKYQDPHAPDLKSIRDNPSNEEEGSPTKRVGSCRDTTEEAP